MLTVLLSAISASAQSQKIGDFIESTSYNLDKIGVERHQQYWPLDDGFVCDNGTNRFTRALYGGWTDYRIETSDRPVFAIVKKNHHRHLRFLVNGMPLDSTDYCRALYVNGMRIYSLRDHRWGEQAELALQVAEQPHECYIIELSSFQLDNMYDFRANIAILLNITPDHLDRYGNCMQNYVDAKMRIVQNQTADDSFIYWNDDPIIKRELSKYDIKAIQYPFSELKEKGSIGYIEEGQYTIEKPQPVNMEQEYITRWLPV